MPDLKSTFSHRRPAISPRRSPYSARVHKSLLVLGVAPVAISQAVPNRCGSNYYENAAGNCVQRPSGPASSAGSRVRCADGTYSFSQTATGTCSRHGGTGGRGSTAKPRTSSAKPTKPRTSTSKPSKTRTSTSKTKPRSSSSGKSTSSRSSGRR
ncbi:DUF3761 domain-containing protein [Tsukamurella sp. DT100]|uniref:DUF3761 domain-containing protein n=1 Tax=Tsukamurella sp. DT100 TaxID=3393415 RepID=UPI003CF1D46A